MANIADAIAYNNHDVDDGIRAGLLSIEKLREQPLFDAQFTEVRQRYPDLEGRRLVYETIRRMINFVVTDLIDTTQAKLNELNLASIDAVRNHDSSIAAFSDQVQEQHLALKSFLMKNLYKHDKVREMTVKAQQMVEKLFQHYMANPAHMPEEFFATASRGDESEQARVVADYVAGMTDRYAIAEYERLT